VTPAFNRNGKREHERFDAYLRHIAHSRAPANEKRLKARTTPIGTAPRG
jgi:hypothetical protein